MYTAILSVQSLATCTRCLSLTSWQYLLVFLPCDHARDELAQA
jgi:hypothetical protein